MAVDRAHTIAKALTLT